MPQIPLVLLNRQLTFFAQTLHGTLSSLAFLLLVTRGNHFLAGVELHTVTAVRVQISIERFLVP